MKKVWKVGLLMAALLMLHGCATAYGKRGITGGYSEQKVDSSHYVVEFDGNGYASKDRVWYFWIYRCAELTRSNGYTYFSLEADDHLHNSGYAPDGDVGGRLVPAVLTDQDDGRLVEVGGAGGYIYIPGQTITTWHSRAMVSMYGDKLPERTVLMKARSVLDLLVDYIRSDGKSDPPAREFIIDQAAYALAPDKAIVNLHQYKMAHPSQPRKVPPFLRAPGQPAPTLPPFLAAPGQKT
ncbi:CC0125/CC1285 family lipoprotein [Rhodanobacter spathiphylli]|uniref:Lipoprotein n=1 Tax=Rhodanobacter spathiphylli B39 TaxID=1163407 RepID=I4VVM9_9GAMM|nr:hypothetical protein [Rhodanobacter spathiphylli]EIL91270.1 hypothetical protein UU7_13708 [Rhodanobacter spathiphylli B39]